MDERHTETLNETLKKRKDERYDKDLELEIRKWLFDDLKLAGNNYASGNRLYTNF